jgi:hypothetical protein
MTYTVTQLITRAYSAAGIVSQGFETLSGEQLQIGLDILNDIIADKTIEKDMIPYFTKYEFFGVAGQEAYYIPNLEQLETLTFFINNVRYQMRNIDRKVYFGTSRANNINSLPYNWHLERCFGGANIYLYFFPQTNYPIEAWGTFRLTSVALNQDLNSSTASANLGVASVAGIYNFTNANLGNMTIVGGGVLAAGELVVDGVDLAGTYTSINAFVNYINTTGVIPNVTAYNPPATSQVQLRNSVTSITITTAGTVSANGITFANFSTTGGAQTVKYTAPGTFLPGQFVVNNVDLAGEYANPQALVNYINSNVVPNVSAGIVGTQFYLYSINNTNINVVTSGNEGPTTWLTFSNFSTLNGPLNQTFMPQGLDLFYINYLKFSLADRLCTEDNLAVPPGVAKQLLQYQNWISKRSAPLDLTQTKISSFSKGSTLSYGAVNLGLGFPVAG